jgi:hypothetical protein
MTRKGVDMTSRVYKGRRLLHVLGYTHEEVGVGRRGLAVRGSTLVLTGLVVLTACSDDGVKTEPGPSPTGAVHQTATPTSTIDPKARSAVEAYESFMEAAINASRRPFKVNDKIPADADFTKYSFDPFRTQYKTFIWQLAADGGEYRGTPPTLNVKVKSMDLDAKPLPIVVLSECQTSGSEWRQYNTKTGKVLPRQTQKVKPPHRSTVTVIFYRNRWGVQKIAFDSSRTCTP